MRRVFPKGHVTKQYIEYNVYVNIREVNEEQVEVKLVMVGAVCLVMTFCSRVPLCGPPIPFQSSSACSKHTLQLINSNAIHLYVAKLNAVL